MLERLEPLPPSCSRGSWTAPSAVAPYDRRLQGKSHVLKVSGEDSHHGGTEDTEGRTEGATSTSHQRRVLVQQHISSVLIARGPHWCAVGHKPSPDLCSAFRATLRVFRASVVSAGRLLSWPMTARFRVTNWMTRVIASGER
jgi:hypothetical protein